MIIKLVLKQLYRSTLITTHVCCSFLSSIDALQGIPTAVTTSCFHPVLPRIDNSLLYRSQAVYSSSLLQERSTRELIVLTVLALNIRLRTAAFA